MIKSCRSIVIAGEQFRAILKLAEIAYPEECCGLLSGDQKDGVLRIDNFHASDNFAEDRFRRFEVDPSLHLRLQRALRGTARRIVGVYHSHPNGTTQPSPIDIEAAWEVDFVWVIISVRDGQALQCAAHTFINNVREMRFMEVPFNIVDSAL